MWVGRITHEPTAAVLVVVADVKQKLEVVRLGIKKETRYTYKYYLAKQTTKNLVVRGASSLRVNLNWSKEQGLAKEHGHHGRRGTPGSSPTKRITAWMIRLDNGLS